MSAKKTTKKNSTLANNQLKTGKKKATPAKKSGSAQKQKRTQPTASTKNSMRSASKKVAAKKASSAKKAITKKKTAPSTKKKIATQASGSASKKVAKKKNAPTSKSTATAKTSKKAGKNANERAAKTSRKTKINAENSSVTSQKKVSGSKKSPRKQKNAETSSKEKTTQSILKQRRRKSEDKSNRAVKATSSIQFSMAEVDAILRQKRAETSRKAITPKAATKENKKVAKKTTKDSSRSAVKPPSPPAKKHVHGAASMSDILGFDPSAQSKKNKSPKHTDDSQVPSKWKKYYRALVKMRDELLQGLDQHMKETLNRSAKDDNGNLSNYSQHMADAGTENFDRDFALSLVSTEQEALQEIEDAIQRIIDGTYGYCEITGKPIVKERLQAVPFTRYSLEGQRQLEQKRSRKAERSPGYIDINSDDNLSLTDEE